MNTQLKTNWSTKLTHVFSILVSAILQRQNIEKTLDLLSSYLHAKPSLALVTSLWQETRFYNDSQTKFPATSAAILASLMIDTAGSIAGAYWYPDYQLLSFVSSIAPMQNGWSIGVCSLNNYLENSGRRTKTLSEGQAGEGMKLWVISPLEHCIRSFSFVRSSREI